MRRGVSQHRHRNLQGLDLKNQELIDTEPEGTVEWHAAQTGANLIATSHGDKEAYQEYLQMLVLASDDWLHQMVTMVTGIDQLKA